jgi:hypothetical protein
MDKTKKHLNLAILSVAVFTLSIITTIDLLSKDSLEWIFKNAKNKCTIEVIADKNIA